MDEISAKNKQELLELLFGKNRANAGAALLTNYKQVYKVIETINKSSGSAEREMNTMAESITFKVNEFKETLTDLGKTIFTQNFLKDIVNTGTSVVDVLDKIIDKIGIIPTILAGISTAMAFKNVGVFNSDIRNNYIQYGQTLISLKSITGDLTKQSVLLALTVQNLTPKQQALALATKGVNQAQIAEILSLNGIEEKQIQQVLLDTAIIQKKKELTVTTAQETIMAQGLNKVTAESIMQSAGIVASNETEVISKKKVSIATLETKLAQEGLSNTQIKAITTQLGLSTSTLTLSNYFKGLAVSAWSSVKAIGAFFATNPVGWVLLAGGAILGVTKLIKKYNEEQKQALQERKESALSAIDTLQSESSQIDSLIDKYTKYISTTSDLTTIKNELTDVQSQLNDAFGEEKSEIDLLNNSYAENIKLINEKKKAESEKFLRDNKQAYNDAKKFLDSESFAQTIYNNDDTYFTKISDDAIKLKALGNGVWSETTKNSWKQIADSLGYNNFVLESNSNIAYIGGTPEQQIQTLEKFYDVYEKQIEGLTDKKYQDRLNAIGKILSDITQKYQDATNIVEEYEKQQNFSEDVAFFEDENKNNLYTKLTNDIIELNQQFEQANSTASKLDLIDKINSAYDELQKLVAGNKIAKESVESLFNGFSSGINQYINSITSSADTYISTFTDYTENGFKTATENIDTFKSALQSLNDDGYVSAETMWKLIEMDSSLSDSFVKVADGFRISSDKIIDSKDELIKKELEYAESEADTSKKILTNLKLRLQAIQKQKEIEKQYLQDNGGTNNC